MARWLLKAAIQNSISLLPAGDSWNFLFQKYATHSVALSHPQLRIKLKSYAGRHIENWFRSHGDPPLSVVELGTGWYPIIPVAFYLCGASAIWTIDNRPLLWPANLRQTLHLFAESQRSGKLREILPRLRAERAAHLEAVAKETSGDATDVLAELNIRCLVQDARYTGLPAGSVDFVFSNSVLQEITPDVLGGLFREFKRILTTAGTMSHYVNMVEPYAASDPALTPFHFLGYSDRAWRLINNKIHSHNRLRISDYRQLHRDAHFELVAEENECGKHEHLEQVRLAPRFQGYSRDDLLALRSWLLSRPIP